jgi:hypothetical protein
MLFAETVAAYCENHTEHTETVSTSQETASVYCENRTEHTDTVSTSQETASVYCENHTEHTDSPYLTGNTLSLLYRAQPVIGVWENNRCLLRERKSEKRKLGDWGSERHYRVGGG